MFLENIKIQHIKIFLKEECHETNLKDSVKTSLQPKDFFSSKFLIGGRERNL